MSCGKRAIQQFKSLIGKRRSVSRGRGYIAHSAVFRPARTYERRDLAIAPFDYSDCQTALLSYTDRALSTDRTHRTLRANIAGTAG